MKSLLRAFKKYPEEERVKEIPQEDEKVKIQATSTIEKQESISAITKERHKLKEIHGSSNSTGSNLSAVATEAALKESVKLLKHHSHSQQTSSNSDYSGLDSVTSVRQVKPNNISAPSSYSNHPKTQNTQPSNNIMVEAVTSSAPTTPQVNLKDSMTSVKQGRPHNISAPSSYSNHIKNQNNPMPSIISSQNSSNTGVETIISGLKSTHILEQSGSRKNLPKARLVLSDTKREEIAAKVKQDLKLDNEDIKPEMSSLTKKSSFVKHDLKFDNEEIKAEINSSTKKPFVATSITEATIEATSPLRRASDLLPRRTVDLSEESENVSSSPGKSLKAKLDINTRKNKASIIINPERQEKQDTSNSSTISPTQLVVPSIQFISPTPIVFPKNELDNSKVSLGRPMRKLVARDPVLKSAPEETKPISASNDLVTSEPSSPNSPSDPNSLSPNSLRKFFAGKGSPDLFSTSSTHSGSIESEYIHRTGSIQSWTSNNSSASNSQYLLNVDRNRNHSTELTSDGPESTLEIAESTLESTLDETTLERKDSDVETSSIEGFSMSNYSNMENRNKTASISTDSDESKTELDWSEYKHYNFEKYSPTTSINSSPISPPLTSPAYSENSSPISPPMGTVSQPSNITSNRRRLRSKATIVYDSSKKIPVDMEKKFEDPKYINMGTLLGDARSTISAPFQLQNLINNSSKHLTKQNSYDLIKQKSNDSRIASNSSTNPVANISMANSTDTSFTSSHTVTQKARHHKTKKAVIKIPPNELPQSLPTTKHRTGSVSTDNTPMMHPQTDVSHLSKATERYSTRKDVLRNRTMSNSYLPENNSSISSADQTGLRSILKSGRSSSKQSSFSVNFSTEVIQLEFDDRKFEKPK